jgi:hypothetical protein
LARFAADSAKLQLVGVPPVATKFVVQLVTVNAPLAVAQFPVMVSLTDTMTALTPDVPRCLQR